MDVRSYDPALARFTSIDPVVHYEYSTFNAFDNNPVFWADPSGADAEQIEGGWSFTGEDAQNAFSVLKSAFSSNNSEDCPSCETEEDWENYYSQAENTGRAVGDFNVWSGLGRRITTGYDEDGHTLFYLDGELQDLERRESWLDAFSSVVPTDLLLINSGFSILRLFSSSKTGLSTFESASKYGIKSYKELTKLIKGKGLQAHHLIEQRFANILGVSPSSMKAIALTKAEHQVFTNAWRNSIGYSTSQGVNTINATKSQVFDAAREIYKDYPQIIKALGL